MIKIIQTKVMSDILTPGQLAAGDIGIIVVSPGAPEWVGHIVLKTFNSLVSLTDPKSTWDVSDLRHTHTDKQFKIELFKPGSTILLEVQ